MRDFILSSGMLRKFQRGFDLILVLDAIEHLEDYFISANHQRASPLQDLPDPAEPLCANGFTRYPVDQRPSKIRSYSLLY